MVASAGAAQPAIEVIEPSPGAAAAPARAPEASPSGEQRLARRVVRAFGFEERDINELRVPLFWHVAQHNPPDRDRPGFPVWNRPSLDYTVAASGEGSVRLPVRGGSVSLRLDAGTIPVFEGGDYRIAARVRTEDLDPSRASISARFLDEGGRPIAESEVRSRLVGGTSEESWARVEVDILGLFPAAAFLQVDLEVLQPSEFMPADTPTEVLRLEDQEGAAWFDEVVIRQIAQVELSAAEPIGLFAAEDTPTLRALVRDMTGERLTARLRVRDLDGRLVSEWTRSLGAAGLKRDFPLELPAYGWYEADLEVFDASGSIGRSEQSFGWLAPRRVEPAVELADAGDEPMALTIPGAAARLGPAFGLMVDDAGARVRPLLTPMMRALGLDLLEISLWGGRGAEYDDPGAIDELRRIVSRVRDLGGEVSLAYRDLPEPIASGPDADARSVGRTVLSAEDLWLNRIDPALERFGQSVRRWSFGGDWTPGVAGRLEDRLGRLVPAGEVVLDSDLWDFLSDSPRAPRGVRLSTRVRPGTSDRQIAESLGGAGVPRRVGIEMTEQRTRAGFDDVLRRAFLSWEAIGGGKPSEDAGELALVEPWRWVGRRQPRLDPRPELVAWETVGEVLRDRRPMGRVDLGAHALGLLLSPRGAEDGGAIVAWTDLAGASLELMLAGEAVRVLDPFGNEHGVSATRGPDGLLRHRVALGSTPVIIEGVDPALVRFQRSVSLDEPVLATANRTLERSMTIHNPFPYTAEIRYFVVEPGEGGAGERGWEIEPRSGRVQIEPGGSATVPIEIAMSPLELSGRRDLVLHAEVRAGRDLGLIELRALMVLGDPGLVVDANPYPSGHADDLLVEVSIANDSAEARVLELVVVGEGDRRRTTLSALAPGEQAVRRVVLARSARGEKVFVSIEDLDTGDRVNRLVDVP